MGRTEYSCLNCANKATPICKVCNYILNPQKKITHKPPYFAGCDLSGKTMNEAPNSAKAIGRSKTACIEDCIKKGLPIPILPVMLYNMEVEMKYKTDD